MHESFPKSLESFIEQVVPAIRGWAPSHDEVACTGGLLVLNKADPGDFFAVPVRRMVDLSNIYRDVVAQNICNTGNWLEHVVTRVTCILADPPVELTTDLPWADVRLRVFPHLVPQEKASMFRDGLIPHREFVGDVIIKMVFDMPEVTFTITHNHLAKWGVSEEEAMRQAIENLSRETEALVAGPGQSEAIKFIDSKEKVKTAVMTFSDAYDAARILWPGLRRFLMLHLGGTSFLVAVPSRDMLIAFPEKDCGLRGRLAPKIRMDHARLPYPVSSKYFLLTADGVSDASC